MLQSIPAEGHHFRRVTRNFVVAILRKPVDCKQELISSTRAVKIREGQANGTQYAAWITFLRRYLPRNKGRHLLRKKTENKRNERERERERDPGFTLFVWTHEKSLVHVEIKVSARKISMN